MVFVKLRVLGDSGGKGEQNCRMSLAFWPFLERKRRCRKEEEEHEKGEEDRSTEKRKPICQKCANIPSVFAVFVKWETLYSQTVQSTL